MNPLTRRVATLSVATLALASAVLVGTAGAALAIAAPMIVATASTFGSPTSAVATSTCPAGTALVGTGGRVENLIGGGGGDVVLTDIIPNVAAGTVTVWGHENGPFAGDWSVVAYAICDTVITGVVQVATVTAFNAVTPKAIPTPCPGGTALTGTGYRLRGGNGEVFPEAVVPLGLGGTQVSAVATAGFAGNWDLTAYALCAPVPAGAAPTIVANTSVNNAASPKDPASGSCPALTRLTGTGAQVNNGNGNVILDQLDPNVFTTASHARGIEPAPYAVAWNLTAYGICW